MRKKLHIISGTFEYGCSIMVRDEDWKIYNLLVLKDESSGGLFVELHGEQHSLQQLKEGV